MGRGLSNGRADYRQSVGLAMFGLSGIWGALFNIGARFLSNLFKDWRRDEELKDKGRVEQQNADMKEADRRGSVSDGIRGDVSKMTDEELDAYLKGDEK
jgi:hypothetical protein